MQIILKNRETRKVPKLKDILNDAVKRQQKEQAAKRHQQEANSDIRTMLAASLKPALSSS